MPNLPVLSVTECIRSLNEILTTQVICVEGEIKSLAISQGKWAFFSLKDVKGESIIDCFAVARRLTEKIDEGTLVRVVATPSIYAKSGRFRLVVESIEAVGAGYWQKSFAMLKAKLEIEGLFAIERKRKLAPYPQRIGLIASSDSAAYSDFLKVLRNRFADIEIIFSDVPVQGEKASRAIQRSLIDLGLYEPKLDLILITRGGGSSEDLAAFNDEQLARTIFRCPVPVVTAIGHERDISIADLTADLHASTPSNAAELIAPHQREILAQIQATQHKMVETWRLNMTETAHEVDRYAQVFIEILQRREIKVRHFSQGMLAAGERLTKRLIADREELRVKQVAIWTSLMNQRNLLLNKVKTNMIYFEKLHPRELLKRGYSIVRLAGEIVRSRRDLRVGGLIDITFSEGGAEAKVTSLK